MPKTIIDETVYNNAKKALLKLMGVMGSDPNFPRGVMGSDPNFPMNK